jgi:hypothetical protein
VFDHGGVGGGIEIEVNRLAGMHRKIGSFKLKSQPTMLGWGSCGPTLAGISLGQVDGL